MSDVKVKFSAEDQNLSKTVSNLQRDLERLDSKSKDASKGFDMSFGKIGLAAGVAGVAVKAGMMAVEAATAAASAVVAGFGQAIDLGGQLTDLSSRTGETAGSLLVLQRAFENTGVGADKVGPSLNKLQKFMADAAAGGAEQSATLTALGLSMQDLAGKTPTEQMQVLAKKIAGISDPAERARASMEVFGKSGGELLPLLNNFSGELDGARGQLGSLPDVMDRSARTFDDFGDGIGALSSKAMEFAAGFLESALPALNTFTAALSGIDAAGWGQKAMEMTRQVADTLLGAFKDPLGAIEAWTLSAERFYKTLGNGLVNSALTFTDFLMKSFETNLPSAIKAYLTQGFIDSTLTFSRHLIQALMTFSEGLSTIPGFENAANKMFEVLDSANERIIAQQLDNLGKSKDAAAAVVEEFGKAKDKTTLFKEDFFGVEESTKRMNEKFKELEGSGKKVRQDFMEANASTEEVKKNTSSAVSDAAAIAGSFNKAEGSTKKIKEELSTSAKLMKDISDAQAKDSVDKGGRLQKQMQNQISQGNFTGARNTARKVQQNEIEQSIRGTGQNRDSRSLSDIGKGFGLRQQMNERGSDFAKRVKDAKEGNSFADKFGRSVRKGETKSDQDSLSKLGKDKDWFSKKLNVDKPNKDGSKGGDSGGSGGDKNKPQTLDAMVSALLELVKKIEPKLPTSALAA
jgi:hypothetical protein